MPAAVEVTHRDPALGINVAPIPQELIDWAASSGRVVMLATQNENMRPIMASLGKFVLCYDEIPNELHKGLRRLGYSSPSKFDGEIRMGDCVMFIQSEQLRDDWREEWNGRQRAREDQALDEPDRLNEEWGRRGVPGMRAKIEAREVHSTRDHVRGGAELAQSIMEELAEAETPGKNKRK